MSGLKKKVLRIIKSIVTDKLLTPQTYFALTTWKYYPLSAENQLKEMENHSQGN